MLIPYVEGSVVGVPLRSPTTQNPPIFINTATGDGVAAHPPGVWSTVDVSSIVPADTLAVRLDGILIITHGTTVETADLTVAFRTDQNWDYGYIMQTCEASAGNGQRSNAGVWVSLDANKCFQIKWTRSTQDNWPTNSSYGINLTLTAYLRPGTQSAPADLTAINQEISALQSQVQSLQSQVQTLQQLPPGSDARLTQLIDLSKTL